MISYECQVEYVCPRCDATDVEIIAAPVADYILEHDNPDARYAFAQIEVVCGYCDKELTLMVENNDDVMSASIPAYPGTKVSVSEAYMVESEDFLPELDFPPDPATFLISAMVDVHEVREATKHMGQTSIVTRMAFVQLFAAFEAFLSDTLIGIVLENPEVFKRALAGIKGKR